MGQHITQDDIKELETTLSNNNKSQSFMTIFFIVFIAIYLYFNSNYIPF